VTDWASERLSPCEGRGTGMSLPVENPRPLQCLTFRGSIPHPMQSLCTLRNHCRQWPRNTRYQADATPYLDRTCTGWIAPALPGAPIRSPRRRVRATVAAPRRRSCSAAGSLTAAETASGVYASLFGRLSGRERTRGKSASRASSVPILKDRSTAKRRGTTGNDRLLQFMAQLPLGRRVWNDVAGCHWSIAFLPTRPERPNSSSADEQRDELASTEGTISRLDCVVCGCWSPPPQLTIRRDALQHTGGQMLIC
jgi:hypothetical protein